MNYPKQVLNWIDNKEKSPFKKNFLDKYSPSTGRKVGLVARSDIQDVEGVMKSALNAYPIWSKTSIVTRANILREATQIIQKKKHEIAKIVSLETGKSLKDALGETEGAIELGFFIASEGRRFYGRTTTSAVPNRFAYTIRQPIGICALIIAANTPIANVAWKAFPALLCGNSAIMKPAEDTPQTAIWFAKVLKQAGLPAGVFSIIQGLGEEVGAALVEDERVSLVSFTGSVGVGQYIQSIAGKRLAKVCLELGGKNPLVVCDDADLERAAVDTILSAFSNTGQRCASGSRIIVFESVYEQFKKILLEKTKKLKLGSMDSDDFGPVINKSQLEQMLEAVNVATNRDGARILIGGKRSSGLKTKNGFFMEPTILEDVLPNADISQNELFGPITCLYKVKDFSEAIALANNSQFGLTAAIHTTDIDRAEVFKDSIQAGVVSINGPTYGSEPHMPFGGVKNSGNGFREPGTESLDIYSELKTVYIRHFPLKT